MERGWVRPRPALDRRLDGALTHRLTCLVATTGYGKSTALAGWGQAVGAVLHRLGPADRDLPTLAGTVAAALSAKVPGLPADLVTAAAAPLGPDADEPSRAAALASALAEALAARLRRGLVLVFDGIEAIAGAAGPVRYVETLVRVAPRHLHLVTASRAPLPFPTARLRQDHEVLDLDAGDLALTPDETAAWARELLGEAGADVAAELHRTCGGWPAAVQAALDALAREDPATWRGTVAGLTANSATLERLTLAAFKDLPAAMRELLRAATVLPVLTSGLAATLGAPPDTPDALASRGLFLEPAEPGGHRLTSTACTTLARHLPLDRHEAHDVAAVAARWYVEHDRPELALRAAVATAHAGLAATLLDAHGPLLAERGDVLAALELLPEPARRTPPMLKLAGIAEQNRGHWTRARELLAEAAAGPGFDAAVARRLAFIDHMRGEFDLALPMYERGHAYGLPPADAAMCAASMASVYWLKGDRAACAELADRALEQARSLGDASALAMANTVLAMLAALDGDRRANDAYYLRALAYAERAGDLVQLIRIHANRASRHLDEAAYAEALAETEIAGRLSDLVAFAPFAALNISNRAKALIGLGRLEEAAAEAADAAARWEAMGSRLTGAGLNRLAAVHALRGDRAAAAALYRQVIAASEPTGEVQALSQALNGLAELLAAEDPEEATRVAARALEHVEGITGVAARVAAARVALAAGEHERARTLLDETEPVAAGRRDHAALAAVAELRAELDGDAKLADEAVRRWAAVGDPIGRARAELVRAALADPATGGEVAAEVRERMHTIGCRALDDRIDALVARAGPPRGAKLVVETMGTFRVLRGSAPVPRTAWQSRKARDLLKILVSRRGGAIGRERLVEILWPEQEDEAVGLRRLNVMVSTLRAVLDPGHAWPADEFVVSDEGALRLELSNVEVDVESFMELVGQAVRLEQAGRQAEALARWAAAESAYGGEFCEEDPYADWAVGLREQLRLAYVQAAARLAEARAGERRHDEAARYWLRLLERDRYDERAHLGLVRVLDLAGRRGDARRRYRLYAELMRELEVEPAPYPT
ncbi:BTAD domain-containing putative transcriptional regulator [Nonomuraea rubra]|uniref:ATP/maltotriose-dependent transcriptional regulator MalT/DNA-binding SARP family transcriptional activator n=1 Tax=Nonomuraea rubra TaxID=46180 RepID=A0A7X0P7W3_9ACTN|nr:BTAD domain-containing putative transcriptional regulator [Nonomuraea rubra]MBB6556871.1 ATP/maltotriose-dependent transcriptional regulator MalT/DNA-binding SARP family transcriptional activator [Nonomuraea rubra]